MEPAWQGGFPIQPTAFGLPFDAGQNHEDWEDWLRWDPTLEPTSPEDGTATSGSSKNDSPIQNSLLPVEAAFRGKNETLAPPLIVGEDTFGLDGHAPLLQDDAYIFGDSSDGTDSFDFQAGASSNQLPSAVAKIDSSVAAWPFTAGEDMTGINLSALSNENSAQVLPSAGTVSSNAPTLPHSPDSTTQNRTSISSNSPDPPKKRGRKRKIDIEQAKREQNGDSQEDGDEPPEKKTSHNVIEKRYRNNLNDKIVELRNSVPSLRAMGKSSKGDDTEDLEGLTPAHKLNKATIMAKATEYIRHLEKRNKVMADEMEVLKSRLASVETMIGKSKERQASVGNDLSNLTTRSRNASSASQNGAQGFLNVPQDQARINQQVAQQQYMQPQQQPNYNRQPAPPVEAQNQPQYVPARRGGGVMNKVMVGAMAGMMVMEGFSESQSGDDGSNRALFSVPTSLFKRGVDRTALSSPGATSSQMAFSLMKIVLVVGALLYLLAPLLTFSPRRKQSTRSSPVRLPHPPSLASPIEVRRKAWLTAIQTVWVPKHFLLEVAAVTLKMISLSLRRLIGSEAFNSLTGANKDDEVARIKCWDIAIDAQLAGGDQEVSYYRLLLTLMESGTLPDSPTRLMQKAVHFRVFFWEVANAGYGNMIGFTQATENVGKFYWDCARRLQKELVQAKAQGRPLSETIEDEVEVLPDHLARLVELECEDVLSDEMIQRAWNLAWNKPSAYRTAANVARDAVVEDHAIRSPLDAVAAWYANMTIDETLAESLHQQASTLDTEYYIGLAVSVAPPGSATLARALAAKAILSTSNRDANILSALDALPAAISSTSSELNVVTHVPATPDVRTALTLAKLLALSSPTSPAQAQLRALDTIASLHIAPSSFTLLTAVSTLRLLRCLGVSRACLSAPTAHGLEGLAASLRVWVGTSSGRNAGLDGEACAVIVDLCLEIAKRVGGWECDGRDSGYGSGSAGYGSAEGSPVRENVLFV